MNEFRITKQHLVLLQRAYVGWDNCEFGAPAINCKRPYGNSNVIGDMIDILLGQMDREIKEKLEESMADYLIKLHKELEIALQICLVMQQFKEGLYVQADQYNMRSWKLKP